jgi:16S rRNA (uracil1498-N3)-methyltransferase
MTRVRRVWHPGAREGHEIDLSSEESHHVSRVLRLREGDSLRVFDGEGREWDGEVVTGKKAGVRVRVGGEVEELVESPLAVVVCQALGRLDRMDWVVQKATEAGASAVSYFASERSESARGAPGRVERWRRIALAACKQSGRRVVPRVELIDTLPGPVPESVLGLLLDPHEESRPVAGALAGDPLAEVWIAVGPEGGFSPGERRTLVESGWTAVGLGPRTLRTETAALVACAIVLHAWGDLGR